MIADISKCSCERKAPATRKLVCSDTSEFFLCCADNACKANFEKKLEEAAFRDSFQGKSKASYQSSANAAGLAVLLLMFALLVCGMYFIFNLPR
jgi:hypothetical protein